MIQVGSKVHIKTPCVTFREGEVVEVKDNKVRVRLSNGVKMFFNNKEVEEIK